MIFSALFTLAAIIITVFIFIFPSSTTPTGRFGVYDTFAMWVFTYLMIRWTVKRAFGVKMYAPSYFTLLVLSVTTIIGLLSGITKEWKYDINGRVALAFFLVHAAFGWPGIKDLIVRWQTKRDVYDAIEDGVLPNDKEDLIEYMDDGVITQEEGQKILDKKKKEDEAKGDSGDDKDDDKDKDASEPQTGGANSFIKFALKNGNRLFNQFGGDDDGDEEEGGDPEYTMPSEEEVDFIEEAETENEINKMIANNPYINPRTVVDAPLIAGWLLYVIIEPLVGSPTKGPFVNMWNSYVAMFKNLRKPTNLWGYFCQFKWPALIFTLYTIIVKLLTLIPLIWILKMILIIVVVLAVFFYIALPLWENIVSPLLSYLVSSVGNMMKLSALGTGGMMGGLSNSLL